MFEVNGTLVIFIISFLLFILAFNEIFLKPVGKVIEKRAKHMQDNYDAAKGFKHEAEESVSQYEKHLHAIREQAQSVITNAVNGAQKIRDSEVAKVQEQGREKVAQ